MIGRVLGVCVMIAALLVPTESANARTGGGFSGQVVDKQSGMPLRNVWVRVLPETGTSSITTEMTNAAGRYEVTGLADGNYRACFDASHVVNGPSYGNRNRCYRNVAWVDFAYPTDGYTLIAVTDGQVTPAINQPLLPAGAIAGTVTRDTDGAPARYVVVRAYDRTGAQVGVAVTAADGSYLIPRLAPSTRGDTVCFDTAYYDRYIRGANPYGLIGTCPSARVPVVGGTITDEDAALTPAGAIGGRVLDAAAAEPLEGTFVFLYDSAGTALTYTTTNSKGNYTFNRLDPATGYVVCFDGFNLDAPDGNVPECYRDTFWVRGDDPSPDALVIDVSSDTKTTGVSARLPRAGAITGRVLAAGGGSVPGATVRAFDSGEREVAAKPFIQSNGTYRMVGVPPSAAGYTVCFTAPSYLPQCYDRQAWDGHPAHLPASATRVPVSADAATPDVNARLIATT